MKILKLLFVFMFYFLFYSATAQKQGTFKDNRDNKIYKTVRIGKQVWIAENLNFNIPGSCCYYDKPEHCASYGRLYRWEAALKACPQGWHLPFDDEWKSLSANFGDDKSAGGKLKEKGTLHWKLPNTGGTEVSGFNALPGGFRDSDGVFCYLINEYGYYWTSTARDTANIWIRDFNYFKPDIKRYDYFKNTYFSVRCIRN